MARSINICSRCGTAVPGGANGMNVHIQTVHSTTCQSVERLTFGPGTTINSADAKEAILAAIEDQQENSTRVNVIRAYPANGYAPFYTFILIDGMLYQLIQTEWQPSDEKERESE